ncbi:MAG: L-serine ammonia-lyase, iron-sulfur-dependent, subunit alpha [Candidatus Thorarchaeota archaeon]
MVVNKVDYFLRKSIEENKSLGEIMIEHEMEVQEVDKTAVIEAMMKIWTVMSNAIINGVQITSRSPSGMSGGDAFKLINNRKNKSLCGSTIVNVVARAIGVAEFNSSMGTIVAAPTAGSSGVVPAVVFTVAEKCKATDEQIIKGLFASSLIGLICDARASTSGSEHGCQAEIGVATAMAAAAAVEIVGGTCSQAINAAAIALKNSLGLACDPVAGLVEVPCIKRNGVMSASALVAADMALAGIESVIPFDDVVTAMNEIGRLMPCEIKETSEGGLANTKTARGYKNWLRSSGSRQLLDAEEDE